VAASRTGDRQILPIFRNGEMPAPEQTWRFTAARAFALFTLGLTFVYLWWRAGSGTINLGVWWVAIPLFLAEVHNFVGLSLFTAALWRTDVGRRTKKPNAGRSHSVAVVLPTYNEPEEILLPAIAAAVALQPAHETWVLDDGRRPEIRQLAERLGARYLDRPTNDHAKAGNVNNALQYIKADVIAFLDADYVALPGFLERTLPYFDDPRVAVVQTPQDFYNLDSFEHEPRDNTSL
jgi:cellulose synthase/poly-beta-1,6-N-acetylglucosamine synthase-like glycosyltransferase